jgi:hypothetical protein
LELERLRKNNGRGACEKEIKRIEERRKFPPFSTIELFDEKLKEK